LILAGSCDRLEKKHDRITKIDQVATWRTWGDFKIKTGRKVKRLLSEKKEMDIGFSHCKNEHQFPMKKPKNSAEIGCQNLLF
jgi:hypothetical protein